MPSAIEQIRQEFLTQHELAALLNVTPERIRDLRSKHKKEGGFIDSYQPTSKCALFHIDDVLCFIRESKNKVMEE